jgi:hypothetical protein
MGEITNYEDVIDSRDVIERIEELTYDDYIRDESEDAELTALVALAQQGENYSEDWPHGATLIRYSYFKTYAQELADDVCENKPTEWPWTCIDWEQAARELSYDHTSIDFDGVDYWIR